MKADIASVCVVARTMGLEASLYKFVYVFGRQAESNVENCGKNGSAEQDDQKIPKQGDLWMTIVRDGGFKLEGNIFYKVLWGEENGIEIAYM